MPDETGTAIALATTSDQKQLAVHAQKYALADHALSVCGLVRPCSENAPVQEPDGSHVESSRVSQMRDIVNMRGVKQRLEDDFGLKQGHGEEGAVKETLDDFLNRTIVQLRREDVNDVIKCFDRVEKNNRKAIVTDEKFREQRAHFAAKVVADDAEEKAEDIEYGTHHRGSAEEFAEFEDWCQQFEYRVGEKDYCAFANNDVTRPCDKVGWDDGKLAGHDLVKIRAALDYFELNSQTVNAESLSTPTVATTKLEASVIQADLAQWDPATVVSAYRRLSLVKHPDKEGGSPEAFQELVEHAKTLTEASAKVRGVTINKKHTARKHCGGSAASGPPKVAICADLSQELKVAVAYFGLTESNFICSSPAEIKKLRQTLSVLKDKTERQIQSKKGPDTLLAMLREFGQSAADEESEDFAGKTLKQLKSLCVNLCRVHYAKVYAHVQKMK